ncbi:MaoC family dehydratase [Verrucomicrobia bacterium]|jgi:3-hydroxybutyryl-CoA dehydratase|nr:MaoC family dehydratase [Verrucomicrobiota bacterium]
MREYAFEDLDIGTSESFEVEVSAAMLQSFAELSGDLNPLHTDEAYSQESGYEGRVVFGMLTASFYSRLVGMYLPGKLALFQGIDISFRYPVFVGDRLSVTGTVDYLNEAYRQVELNSTIRNQKGKIVSKAKIKTGCR